ncbi:hypothetical protein Q31b_04710 [Novipirellula aureliae]|uniref:Transmembrane protein n=1 Tax=Novipirellula aureliae TaxID=2527966 RepID=A0A5C6E920_9BACT|nr:hypothetical protein [Novipirellula aureliae]TWU45300.1 hypothetical protein Q31b_04710 [Novipirellula aureliae]
MSHTNLPNHFDPAHDFESIADLIERLGRPPEAIVDQWCEQLRAAGVVSNLDGSSSDVSSSSVLPEIDLSKWTILPSGELRCGDRTYSVGSQKNTLRENTLRENTLRENTRQPISNENQRRVEAFRSRLLEVEFDEHERSELKTCAPAKSVNQSDSNRASSTTKLVGIVAAILAFIAAMVGWAVSRPADSVTIVDASRSAELSPIVPDRNRESKRMVDASTHSEAMALETFDASRSDSDEHVGTSDDSPIQRMPVHEMIPKLVMPRIHPLVPQTDDIDSADDDNVISPTDVEIEKRDAFEEQPENSAEEKPQPVRIAKVHAIALPDTNAVAESKSIEGLSTNNLSLEFPNSIDLYLEERPSDRSYLICDGKDHQTIAMLRRGASGHLLFAWDNDGKQRIIANSLQQGRLQDAEGHILYLRPCIEADPWAMSFVQSDHQPSWDLGGMIPAQRSKLSVDFTLPDEIEVGWIEPVEVDRPRGSRCLAVLSHKEFEFVQIAVLLNVRCSRKFAAKIRFAARLDPALPWQTFTDAGLAQLSDQLLQQSERLEQQRIRLEAIYGQADTAGRRNLQDNRASMRSQIEWVTQMTTRVSQLQAMATTLGINGNIRFEIACRWPDTDQKILTMTP